MSNSSIWPIDRILSGVTTLGQSRPGSDDNEGVLCISQSSSITGAWQSDPIQNTHWWGLNTRQRSSQCILQSQPTRQYIFKFNNELKITGLDILFMTKKRKNGLILYMFTQPLCYELDVIKGQFHNGVQLVWIQSFPSPRLVDIKKLKSPVYLTIYLKEK